MLTFILIILTIIPGIFLLPPPSYIKPCKLSEPTFSKCAIDSANAALPSLIKGDKQYKIPLLDPLHLPLVEVQDSNFAITLKNTHLYGLRDATLKDLHINKSYVEITLHAEQIKILGDYLIDTKLLLLAIKGDGRINITAVGGDYRFVSSLKSFERKGENYLKLNEPHLDFTLQRAYFQMDNLFNGDKKLGDEINKFLNDNWSEVIKELGKPISQAIVTIITTVVDQFFKYVPANQLFP